MVRGRGYTHRGAVTKEDRWRRRERASALVTQRHHLRCGLATAGKFGSRISSATGQLYWCSYGAAGDPTAERNWSSCEPISRHIMRSGPRSWLSSGSAPKRWPNTPALMALAFPILVDPDRSVIKRYGVYHRLGLTAFNIARPATFIIDRAQRICFMYISRGQSDRPDHETLVAELQKLRPPQPTSPPPAAGAPAVEP